MGGFNDTAATATMQVYNTSNNSWTYGPSMPEARRGFAAVVWNGSIVVLGGFNRHLVHSMDLYDPSANAWRSIGNMSSLRAEFAAAVIGDYIYVMGGIGQSPAVLNDLLRFDPVHATWETMQRMPGQGADIAAVALNNMLFVQELQLDFDENGFANYFAANNSWSTLALPYHAHSGGALVVLDVNMPAPLPTPPTPSPSSSSSLPSWALPVIIAGAGAGVLAVAGVFYYRRVRMARKGYSVINQ
jgi:hypothetical protein